MARWLPTGSFSANHPSKKRAPLLLRVVVTWTLPRTIFPTRVFSRAVSRDVTDDAGHEGPWRVTRVCEVLAGLVIPVKAFSNQFRYDSVLV
jgi:hypothetical protein